MKECFINKFKNMGKKDKKDKGENEDPPQVEEEKKKSSDDQQDEQNLI
jgi:hypothetical protein